MKKRLIILLCVLFSYHNFLSAQCSIIQNVSNMSIAVNAAEEIGQSFTACNSGALESVQVQISNLSMASINLELKIASGSNTATAANIIHTQVVMLNTAGMLSIPISKDLFLTKGNIYTFSLVGVGGSGNIDFVIGIGDTYTGGNMLRNNNPFATADLEFGVFMAAEPAEPYIPTMSQWGLLIFGLLILNISVLLLYRLQVEFS